MTRNNTDKLKSAFDLIGVVPSNPLSSVFQLLRLMWGVAVASVSASAPPRGSGDGALMP